MAQHFEMIVLQAPAGDGICHREEAQPSRRMKKSMQVDQFDAAYLLHG